MTLRQPHEDAIVTAEEIAFIRRALLACSDALDWIEHHGGPQGQALLAEATSTTWFRSLDLTAFGCQG
jgi:hypothetical protein